MHCSALALLNFPLSDFRFYSIAKNVICRRAGNTGGGGVGNMSPICQQQQRRPLLRRGNSFHLDETASFPENGAFPGRKSNRRQKNEDARFMTRTRLRPGGPAPPAVARGDQLLPGVTTSTFSSYGTPQPALKREVFNGTTFLRLNNNKDDNLEMDDRDVIQCCREISILMTPSKEQYICLLKNKASVVMQRLS